jgi:beta-N-acetylhexosaminidase
LAGGVVLCTYAGPSVPADLAQRVQQGLAAGVVLFASNVPDQQAAIAATTAIQEAAARSPTQLPAIVAIDQEGGLVTRIPGPPSASAAMLGTMPAAAIRAEGAATAANLAAWGVNVDFAPVADVARPGGFIDRQQRSFAGDPAVAATAVAAFVTGLHDGGVATTLKHFPGLGAASMNTDDSTSIVAVEPATLENVDRAPFAAGIAAGSELVMMSSATYSSVDALPAVLSPTWIGLLRTQLQFTGVVVSDAIDAPALDAFGSVGERAVRAVLAGVDLVIVAAHGGCIEIQQALRDAIVDGRLPIDRVRTAYDRVDALRRSV